MSHVLAAEQAVEKALADVAADVPRAAEALAAAQTEFEAVGGYEADKRISNVLSGLGFKQQDFHALASSFSGGWQMRIALARTLLSPAGDAARGAGRAPGLLMLDEPTNHLDNAACAWLADFLSSSGGTVLLVSHDETLLETCTHIAEVRGGKLHHFTGTYTDFLAARTLRDEQALSAAMAAQAEIARTEAFMAKFGAKTAFANAAKSRAKMLDKLRENAAEVPVAASSAGGGDRTKASMRFPKPPPCHREVIKLVDASVGWNDTPLLSNLNLTIEKGQRVLVLGPNGAGKSTLLRAIAGAEPLLGGEHRLGEGAKLGYFVQDLAQELPLDKPGLEYVLETAREDDPDITTEQGRKALGALGLLGDTPLRRIGELSGGEKSRVALARFALVSNNVLLLDEVSNHLDASTIEMLTSALQSYEGAIVAITHNKLFASGLNATHVLRVEDCKATLKPSLGALVDSDFAESKKVAQPAAGVPRKTPKKVKAPTAEEELEAMRAAARAERYAMAGNSTQLEESDNKPKSKNERLAAKKAAEEKVRLALHCCGAFLRSVLARRRRTRSRPRSASRGEHASLPSTTHDQCIDSFARMSRLLGRLVLSSGSGCEGSPTRLLAGSRRRQPCGPQRASSERSHLGGGPSLRGFVARLGGA